MSLSQSTHYFDSGEDMRFAIRRKADMLLFDFADGTFKTSPGRPMGLAPEEPAPLARFYTATVADTPVAQFPDGAYQVLFLANGGKAGVVWSVEFTMQGGSDEPSFPQAGSKTVTLVGTVAPIPPGG